MTHVMSLSAKMRRNERLWQTLDIGNMFKPTFGFKKSQLNNEITKKNSSPLHFYFPRQDTPTPPYTSPCLVHNLLSDRLWAPLL